MTMTPPQLRRLGRPALTLAAVAAVAATAGCGDVGGAGESGEARQGGTVVIAAATPIETLNGLTATEYYSAEVNRFLLYLPLLRYGPELGYEPALAESWELQADTGVVFHLRRDVRWHDGGPTTAHDVAFTWQRAKDPATGYANTEHFDRWTGVEVLDSFTVRFAWEPHVDPLAGVPMLTIMPAHLLDSVPPERMRQASFNQQPVGNGPFRFVSARANDRWIFEANPGFPEALGGRPNVDRLVWRLIEDRSARIAELQSGEAQLILGAPGDRLDALAERTGLRAIVRPTFQYGFIAWNGRREPFDDPRVRRALTMALDRQGMLDALRGGYGEVATGPVLPQHWAYNHGLEPPPYDPAAARSLLDRAGWRDRDGDGLRENAGGEPLAFAMTVPAESAYNRQLSQVIQSQLREIGVDMEIRPVETNAMIGQIVSPERPFDAFILSFASDFRINLYNLFHSGALDTPFQFASYSNPEVDSLIDAISLETDQDSAASHWARLQEILLDEQPWSFLDYTPDLYLARESLRGMEMDLRGFLVNVAEWWIDGADGTGANAAGVGVGFGVGFEPSGGRDVDDRPGVGPIPSPGSRG